MHVKYNLSICQIFFSTGVIIGVEAFMVTQIWGCEGIMNGVLWLGWG